MKLTKQQKNSLKELVFNRKPFRCLNLSKPQHKAIVKYLRKLKVYISDDPDFYVYNINISVDNWRDGKAYFIASPVALKDQNQPIINLFL